MRESNETIAQWCAEQRAKNMTILLVVCDTYDYSQYPVGTTARDFWEQYEHHDENMQRVEGIYDLTQEGLVQLSLEDLKIKIERPDTFTFTLPKNHDPYKVQTVKIEIDHATGNCRVIE
jgi:hypothetical protein